MPIKPLFIKWFVKNKKYVWQSLCLFTINGSFNQMVNLIFVRYLKGNKFIY